MVVETGRVPRDDRAWPRGAAFISIGLVLASLGAAAWLLADSADRGAGYVLLLLASLGISSGVGFVGNTAALRRWVRGHNHRGRDVLVGLLAAGLAIAIFNFDPALGGVIFAGMMGGVLLANLWVMRSARANREAVDAAEAAFARQRDAENESSLLARGEASHAAAEDSATDNTAVGQALRQAAVEDARRLIAWLVAFGIVAAILLPASGAPSDVGVFIGLVALLPIGWVGRRLWGVWLAIWDYRRAATRPRRAFVVLIPCLNHKSPRLLLAVWPEPPYPRGGRLPVPERVFVCDGVRDALESTPGQPAVHEAWVDTGKRSWYKPRWVAADAGVVVPQRRSLFGRWQAAFLMNSARPGRPSPLTVPAPHPDLENVRPIRSPKKLAVAIAWRLGTLLGLGLVVALGF